MPRRAAANTEITTIAFDTILTQMIDFKHAFIPVVGASLYFWLDK
jgi:hypothetical protein